MLVLSNNCCGGRLYQQMNERFNNPFIWMVSPYDSILYTMQNFNNINWYDYEIIKSDIRKNTFIVKVENFIELHYVHYKFDPIAREIKQEKQFDTEEHWTGDVYYYKIWEYIDKKYLERTQRMLNSSEQPCFLIRDEEFANEYCKCTLNDIAMCNSNFKRIIITTDTNITRNDNICKTIHVQKIDCPEPTVINNLTTIKTFFGIRREFHK